jgi:hypothetical protein
MPKCRVPAVVKVDQPERPPFPKTDARHWYCPGPVLMSRSAASAVPLKIWDAPVERMVPSKIPFIGLTSTTG